MLSNIDDFNINKIKEKRMKYILEDLSRSIFIAIHKKQGANECELNRTITIMDYVAKFIIQILKNTTCILSPPNFESFAKKLLGITVKHL